MIVDDGSPAGAQQRRNLLTGEWVLVSPQRLARPWLGEHESVPSAAVPPHDAQCYLCPRNRRANDKTNPDYQGVYVFDNDFPALTPTSTAAVASAAESPLFMSRAATGVCRVICFSPRHDLSMSQLSAAARVAVCRAWRDQYEELAQRYRCVVIFENKGEIMGCSNPHPHGQIWAGDFIPNEIAKEQQRQRHYARRHGRALLADYLAAELRLRIRVVDENKDWALLVPYWAVWPFETLLLPKAAAAGFGDLSDAQLKSLAALLGTTLARYDRLFNCPMPYSMGWHAAPRNSGHKTNSSNGSNGGDSTEVQFQYWRLHAHFYPPLLRAHNIKKFMVGYEMLAQPQRDMTPEQAAARLREA